MTFCVAIWVVEKKGPVFLATFKPLGIAIAVFFGAIFLGETLHVGRYLLVLMFVLKFESTPWC